MSVKTLEALTVDDEDLNCLVLQRRTIRLEAGTYPRSPKSRVNFPVRCMLFA